MKVFDDHFVRDVHVIADDWSAVPITSWTVRDVNSGEVIATVTSVPDGYLLAPTSGRRSGIYDSLQEARDAAAALDGMIAVLH